MQTFGQPSFEYRRREKEEESFPFDEAYLRANKILKEQEIQPAEFYDVINPDEIESDLAYVRRMEHEYEKRETPEEKESHKLSDILEAVMHQEIELSDWLGPDTETIRPSRFDDIKNGVDSVIRIRKGGSEDTRLALGIDVTFSKYSLEKKMKRILREIDSGELAEVKYYSEEDEESEKPRHVAHLRVPRIAVGFNAPVIRELGGIWMDKTRKKDLARHPVQHLLADEIMMQLKVLGDYAEQKGKPSIAAAYRKALTELTSSVRKKATGKVEGISETLPAHLTGDRVYVWLKSYMEDLQKGFAQAS